VRGERRCGEGGRSTYEPSFERAGTGECGAVVPEEALARDEVAEGAGEEEEAGEEAEDVEGADAWFGVCLVGCESWWR